MTRNASIACKSSCMIDRLVHAPPLSTVCEASESTLCCCCRQTLPLALVLSARPAAHSRGRMLRDPPPAGSAQPAVLIFIIELVALLASSVLVSDGPAPPPGPRLLPVSAPGLFPYYLTSTPTPTVCLVLDDLDIDSISSFYGSFILL
ncbi:hypothetical protein H0G86_012908 [Trichoderma simmonsii]|uniref:Uncharacterized protein n=1 Tax=Trichoderma simmonsii TaxID=1491479 RepID=A0A8G0LPE7_9HYPO|nr:hypothetical protein H0G86_012908 [Trichoderma simmonsii]